MKSFLSKMMMPYELALKNNLRDSYHWHQWIWKSFPDKPDAKRDFLFRLDIRNGIVQILLLSEQEPQPTNEWVWKTKSVSDGFLQHNVYRFQVKANPTFRRNADRRRIPLYQEDVLLAWFQRKLEAIGCRPRALEVGQPQKEEFQKDGKRGYHNSVDANGIMEVADRNAFTTGFSQGIGPAKGFGFGLIMLQSIDL
ncbi:MAG: type I-E CRISPR-associated protein Cas6/Cse3/CasE [Lentisphaeria bacterium]